MTKEALLRPLSLFTWIEERPASGSRSRPTSSRLKAIQQKEESLRGEESTSGSSTSYTPPVSSKLCSVTNNTFQVRLCPLICHIAL